MTITIAPELEAQVQEKAQIEGLTVEAYVEFLIREDEEWKERVEEPLDEMDPEFEEIRAAVQEGLEQAERGESKPASEVFAELRAKYGMAR